MSEYWGHHFMGDFAGCNDNIKSRDKIYLFVKELVKRIDMIAVGEPIIEYLLPGDPKEGYSLMQLIVTSNICCHFVNPDSTAYLDVFSCKPFIGQDVIEVFNEFFEPKHVNQHFLYRQA